MKTYLSILLLVFSFTCCNKGEIIGIQFDDNGVIISQPFQWKRSLHARGVFHSNGFFKPPIVYNNNIAIPTTGADGTQYMTLINTTKGETIWQWNDVFPDISGDMELFRLYIYNNLLTWQQGSRSYCVNLENGNTQWRFQRDKSYDVRINSFGNSYFTYSIITNNDGYDEQVAYVGDINTGNLTEFLRANLSGDYVAPTSANGGIGGIIYVNEITSNNNLLLITYAEPLPDWNVNSFLGLYNIQTEQWEYERKLMAPPTVNSSVFHTPVIYDNKVYANVGKNLVCHDLYTGEQLWIKSFTQDFLFSGFIIEENKIIANNENLTLYCLDPETCSEIWTGEGAGTSSRMSYLNGIIYFVGGSDGKFHAVDISTGKTIWRLNAEIIEGNDGLFKTNAVYVFSGENGNKGKIIALTDMYAYCFEAYR
ncbi:MAG: PQQ-binding-like beta-propeller repeat protein [Bacteroidales bacterium]|nr:PQQ-binding-like beta-propeller repeat protein [Bacteroidales bacterium]